jgi:hypothetical protein
MPIRECWPWAPCKRVGADGEPDPKQPARHAQTTRIAARFQGIARLHTLTVFGPRCLRCPSPSAERPLRCMDALRRAFCAAQQDANTLADTLGAHAAGAHPYPIPNGAADRHRHAHLGNLRSGLQRIPVDQALKLSAYGIPLDWVYHGRITDLHPHIRAKIRQLQAEERRGDRPGRVSPSRRL